jgi:hypothetical protein
MDFVKWVRKNNRKIMVFVVIFSMVSFVIGSYGIQILVGIFGAGNATLATYDGHKIKSKEFQQAHNELKVLQMLMADRLLLSQQAGLSGPLLVNLLFRDSQLTGDLASQLKQAAQQGQLSVSVDKIEAFFSKSPERPEILWTLLKAEAYRAGFLIPSDSARMTLQGVIPQLSGQQIDAAQLVAVIIRETNFSEEQIIRTFADMMSVLSFAGNVMSNQAVTTGQVRADIARSQERLDAEFVKFNAADYIDANATVSEDELQKQFEAYKSVPANTFSPDNPFGFGYQLPKRVQLEYMVVPMDDVRQQIEKPTAEAVENYYSRNIEQFQSQVPSDPNNPESEKVTQTQSFSEVESSIRRALEEQKMSTLASQIFMEARQLTEKKFETINFDEATAADIQMAAGDYLAAAQQLQEKYKVSVISGKTGLLGPDEFSQRSILNTLSMQQRNAYLPLSELAFAVTEEKLERPRIGLPSIRTWENMGPFSGGFYQEQKNKYQRLMVLTRVIDIAEAQAPERLDLTYDTSGIRIFDDQPEKDTTFSLTEQVKEDVLLQRAMEEVKTRAETLAQLVKDQGWEQGLKTYNETYDPDVRLDSLKQQQRMAAAEMAIRRQQMKNSPASARRLQTQLVGGMLNNELSSLLPAEGESTGTIQDVVEFAPQAAYFVVKDVVRKPATTEDYLENKAIAALKLSSAQSQELALIHFNPENILERMDYEAVKQDPEELERSLQQQEMPLPSGEII